MEVTGNCLSCLSILRFHLKQRYYYNFDKNQTKNKKTG